MKVEPPEGDIIRYVGDERHSGLGPAFTNFNRGKESVVLDLISRPAGRPGLLIDRADVFLAARTCASYASTPAILERNPRLVYCHAVGYGSGGPYRGKPRL